MGSEAIDLTSAAEYGDSNSYPSFVLILLNLVQNVLDIGTISKNGNGDHNQRHKGQRYAPNGHVDPRGWAGEGRLENASNPSFWPVECTRPAVQNYNQIM